MKQVADLQSFFGRVAVVSLASRPNRWREFLENLPSDWPFQPPLRFSAVDGSQCDVPAWWNGGKGAWGCYQSHLQIIEDCLAQHVESILILEDDATFLDGFGDKVRKFLAHLPDDWEFIYLGGQHIHMHDGVPQKLNEWVYRPFNVNRTHAYGLRGRRMLERVAAHLKDTSNWGVHHHVDHRLGDLHEQLDEGFYCPREWLIAQSEGKSDIAGKVLRERVFRNAESIFEARVDLKMCAVLGPYSGGTSAVAGLLHHLGVSMGSKFEKPDRINARGNFEAVGLASLCRRSFTEPWLAESLSRIQRTRLLQLWASDRCEELRENGMQLPIGGKHPLLCLMGTELDDAWNEPAIVVVERDRDAIVNSLAKRNWGWPIDAICSLTDQLLLARATYLMSLGRVWLRIDYEDLIQSPMRAATTLCDFLALSPSQSTISAAVEFINKSDTSR